MLDANGHETTWVGVRFFNADQVDVHPAKDGHIG